MINYNIFLPPSLYMAYNYIYTKQYLAAIGPALNIAAQFWIVFMIAMACEDFHEKINQAIGKLEEIKVSSDKDDNLVIYNL